MRVALGLKAHSGGAVFIAVSANEDGLRVMDRRRIEIVDPWEAWAKQPYHAAEDLDPSEAGKVVKLRNRTGAATKAPAKSTD